MPNEDIKEMLKSMSSGLDEYAKRVMGYFDNLGVWWEVATDAARVGKNKRGELDVRGPRRGIRGKLEDAGRDVDLEKATENAEKVDDIFDDISRGFKRNGAFFTDGMFKRWLEYADLMIKSDPPSSGIARLLGVSPSAFKDIVNEINSGARDLDKKLKDIRRTIRKVVRTTKNPVDVNKIIDNCLKEARSHIDFFFGNATGPMSSYSVHISNAMKKLENADPNFYSLYKALKCYFFLKSSSSIDESGAAVVRFGEKLGKGSNPRSGWFEQWLNEEYRLLVKEERRIRKIDSRAAAAAAAAAAAPAARAAAASASDSSDEESEEED